MQYITQLPISKDIYTYWLMHEFIILKHFDIKCQPHASDIKQANWKYP